MIASELLTAIREAIQADTNLAAWASGQFASPITVYTGIDEEGPPKQNQYPLVAIVDVRSRRGNNSNIRIWDIDLGCAVVNTKKDETETNAVTYVGFFQCEDFRQLVEDALIRARTLGKVTFQGESGTLSAFPVFVSYTTATIEKIITRRNLR